MSFAGATRAGPAGEIVSLAGKGEYRGAAARDWTPARVRQALEGGSFVRTIAIDAKMGVLLADRTQFTLQGVAMAQVKDPGESSAGKSIVDMVKGTVRFQLSQTPARGFAVGTPSGLAAIRGTEWVIDVEDARSVVTVVEGEVEVSNEHGSLTVLPDQQAVVAKGCAPTKRRIQDANELVQWVSAFTVETARYPELKALPYFYDHQERFKILLVHHAKDLGALRLTVDTAEDLELLRQIYSRYPGRDDFSWLEVVSLLEREPELLDINARVQHKHYLQVDERS